MSDSQNLPDFVLHALQDIYDSNAHEHASGIPGGGLMPRLRTHILLLYSFDNMTAVKSRAALLKSIFAPIPYFDEKPFTYPEPWDFHYLGAETPPDDTTSSSSSSSVLMQLKGPQVLDKWSYLSALSKKESMVKRMYGTCLNSKLLQEVQGTKNDTVVIFDWAIGEDALDRLDAGGVAAALADVIDVVFVYGPVPEDSWFTRIIDKLHDKKASIYKVHDKSTAQAVALIDKALHYHVQKSLTQAEEDRQRILKGIQNLQNKNIESQKHNRAMEKRQLLLFTIGIQGLLFPTLLLFKRFVDMLPPEFNVALEQEDGPEWLMKFVVWLIKVANAAQVLHDSSISYLLLSCCLLVGILLLIRFTTRGMREMSIEQAAKMEAMADHFSFYVYDKTKELTEYYERNRKKSSK